MTLLGFLEEDAIDLNLKATSKEGAIRELIQLASDKGGLTTDAETVYKQVMEREARGSTGLGEGIAIPHVKDCPGLTGITGAFARSEAGVPFEAIDGNPVHLLFLILGGEGTASEHVEILKKLAALRMNEHFLRFLKDADDVAAATDIIKEMAGSLT